jgi:hypothetical protein
MLLTGLSTYIPTYTRLQIVVDNLVTYSNIVTVSRLRLNSLNFRYLYGSDSITGTVSANLSMSNQTYALNLPIYIETVNSLHVITSQQLANVVSASNNESISSIDIVAPINIQLTRRDDRYRVYFVRDQGTPEEKKFYSNYLSPQIVN